MHRKNLTSLLPKKEFYSILSQQNISKEDYKYAQKIWQTFEMQSFGDYHDLYLETDVLLLADVFMNYTGQTKKNRVCRFLI